MSQIFHAGSWTNQAHRHPAPAPGYGFDAAGATVRSVRRRMGRVMLGMVAISLLASALVTVQASAMAPGNEYFLRTWERTDRPVGEGKVSRTWMWGPAAFTGPISEEYAEAPAGTRTVQYFDKSRMEITNPNGDRSSPWYVTNGLLVVELVTGRMQTGDNRFVERAPAQVNVGGDADDPTGPTYATFGRLLDIAPRSFGSTIIARVDRNASVSDDQALAGQGVTVGYIDEATDHAIAAPFWEFMNASGAVYEGGQFRTDLLFENPFFATGRPITEAYWARVKVAGSYRDVLLQCFERRCLTYTPNNPAGWQVEAGNVGQHYYAWRYDQEPGDEPIPTPSPAPTSEPAPPPADEPPPTPALNYAYADQWGEYLDTASEFMVTKGIEVSPSGHVYIVEDDFYGRVQKLTTDGYFETYWGGQGSADFIFASPQDVAIDTDGNVYVVEQNGHRVLKFDQNGVYLGQWGTRGSGDGQFEAPQGIAVSTTGRVFVADTGNDRVQMFTSAGEYIGQFGSFGTGDGQFNLPVDIAIDTDLGYAYVVDAFNHRIQVFYYPGYPTSQFVAKWGTQGAGDGQFDTPQGIAVDSSSNVYVADFKNNRVQKFDADGTYLAQWGAAGAAAGAFDGPLGLTVDAQDHVYVVDLGNKRVQKFDADGVLLDLWYGSMRGRLIEPTGLALDAGGNTYVTDYYVNGTQKFDASGTWVMDFGNPSAVNELISGAAGVTASPDGYLYVTKYIYAADGYTAKVVKYTQAGAYVMEWGSYGAGNGQFDAPAGLAVDADGNVYVVDSSNNRIQKFTSAGIYITQWGRPGNRDREFNYPQGIAIHGNRVYVTDVDNHRVQEFTLDGSYVRQWGSYGSNPGQFNRPMGIAVDADGYVYVTDYENDRVQKFTPEGIYLTTIGTAGSANGQLNEPVAVQVDAAGNVYILDRLNFRVQKFVPVP